MAFLGDGQRLQHPEGASFTGVLVPHEVCGTRCNRWMLASGILATTDQVIELGKGSSCTIYQWIVTWNDSDVEMVFLSQGANGRLFVNHGSALADLGNPQVISLCAGMGGSMVGSHAAGFRTLAACDHSSLACDLLAENFMTEIVHGNLLHDETVMALHHAQGDGHPWLEAGFPCQPYSRLGDEKAWQDDRARTFEGVLRIGYLLQVKGVILECVMGASKCHELRQELSHFAKVMGFQILESTQTLENFWPSRRTRWWAILVPSHWHCAQLMDMPQVLPAPNVASLISQWPAWPQQEEDQLAWTEYEQQVLRDPRFGSVQRRLDLSKAAPTALHSLGNHFTKCPCGCRKSGFREERLLSGGIHCTEIVGNTSRYYHPQELGVLLGFPADYKYGDDMRAALCMLGQVAAPTQSCWLFAQLGQIIAQNEPHGFFHLLPVGEVRLVLQAHADRVRSTLHELWPLVLAEDPSFCRIVFADSTSIFFKASPGSTCEDFEKAQMKLDKAEFAYQLWDHTHELKPEARLLSQTYGCNKKPRLAARVPQDQDVVVTFLSDGTRIQIEGKSGDFLFQFVRKLDCPLGGIADLSTNSLLPVDQIIWEPSEFHLLPLTFGSGDSDGFLTELQEDLQMKQWLQIKAEKFQNASSKGIDDVTITYATRFLHRKAATKEIYVFEPLEVGSWFSHSEDPMHVVHSIRKKLEFFDGERIFVILGRDDHWAMVDFVSGPYGSEATYVDGIEGRLHVQAEHPKSAIYLNLLL